MTTPTRLPPRLRTRSIALVAAVVVVLGFALASAEPVRGATRTWTGLGATNNWSDTGNWSGGAVPGAGDMATFDATSAKNATINVVANVAGISITAGYAGTISQGAVTVTVGGTGFSQSGGTFTGSASAVTVNGPFTLGGGVFNAPSGTLSISGAITHTAGGTFTAGSGTVALIGGGVTIDVGTSETYNNLTFTAGNKTIVAGETLNVAGTLTLTAGSIVTGTVAAQGAITQASTFGGGSGTLLINGAAAQTLTGASTTAAGDLPMVSINKPSGTLTLAGTIRTTHNWGYVAGALDPATSLVVFAGGTISGSHTLNSVDFRATTIVAAGSTLTVAGNLSLTAGNLNTGTVAAQGDVSQALGYGGGSTGTLLINGAAAQTLTGASTTAAGDLPMVSINKPSGTLTLAGTIRTTHNWGYVAGALDPATSLVVFAGGTISGSQTLNAVDFRATTSLAAGTTLTAAGAVALTAGNLNGTGTLAAQGDVSQALGYGGGAATLLVNGAAAQTLTGASTTASGNLPALVINKASGTLTLAGTIRTGSTWTYTAGTLDPGTSLVVFAGTLTISGSHTLNDATFNGGNTTYTVAAGTTLTVGGTLTLTDGNLNTGTVEAQGAINQASTFDGNTGTLLIDGAGAQTFTGAATLAAGSLPNVVINKPSGTLTLAGTIRTTTGWTYTAGTLDPGSSLVVFAGNQAITGSHTLNDVTFAGGNTTYTVGAGTTLTVAGTLTLTDGNINTGTVEALGAINQASTFDGASGTLLIDGGGAQTLTGASTLAAGSLPNVVINKSSGTLTLAGTIRTARSWTYTAGTLDPGTSLLVFAGNLTITGSHTLNDVTFNGGNNVYSVAAGTTLTVAGTTTLTDGSIAGGTVAAQGAISQASTFDGSSGTLLINGAAAQTLTGASTTAAGDLPMVSINKPSGTLTLAGTIRTTHNWGYVAGALDPATSLVVFVGGTISGSHTLNSVDFRATTIVAAGSTLTVAGNLSLTAGNLNTGTVAAQGDVSQALGYGGGSTGTLLINGAAAQTLTGASTTAAGDLPMVSINKPSGTLTLAGTIRTTHNWGYVAGALDPATSLVVFAGGTISGSQTLNAVDFRATTSLAAGTTLTAAGAVALTAGNLNGTGTLAAQGDVSQALGYGGGAATLLVNGAAAQTLTGASTTASGNLPALVINKASGTLTLAGTIRTGSTWTYTAGTLAPGTSLVVFAGGTVTSAGSAFYDVSANGGTTTLGSAMSIGHALTVNAGTLTTSAAGYGLTVAGPLSIAGTLKLNASAVSVGGDITLSGTFTAGTSTVTLNGAGGQNVAGPSAMTFYNLVPLDPAGVNLAANVTVTNVLTLFGSFGVGADTLTISNPIAGVITDLVADGTSSLVVNGAAPGIVVPGSVTVLNTLTVNDANGVGLQGDLDVVGTLTLTSGPVATGAATLRMDVGGTVVRTAGRVYGNLEKHVPAGSGVALTFEIGDASVYTPAGVTFGTVTTAGELTASTTTGEHPAIASSGLAATRDVNRFWTLTNGGVAFDTYSATFTFVAGDVDAGANTAAFIVAKDDAGTWTLPAVGTRTGLSTQSTSMTSFSDFAVGEGTADLAVSVDDGQASVVAGTGGYTYTITVTNGGPSDATAVTLDVAWPAGFSEGALSPSQGTCAPLGAGPDFSCALGTVAVGATATVTVPYTVPAATPPGPQVDTATVASATSDPDDTNDTATDSTDVTAVAALAVSVDDGQASVVAGTGGYTYSITVTNGGPSDAHAVVLHDDVPAAFTVGAPSADLGGDCSASSGNTIVCSLPADLAPGATWTISVPYAVAAAVAPQTVVDTATATSTEGPAGVSADDSTDVEAAPSASPGATLPPTTASPHAPGGGTPWPWLLLLAMLAVVYSTRRSGVRRGRGPSNQDRIGRSGTPPGPPRPRDVTRSDSGAR